MVVNVHQGSAGAVRTIIEDDTTITLHEDDARRWVIATDTSTISFSEPAVATVVDQRLLIAPFRPLAPEQPLASPLLEAGTPGHGFHWALTEGTEQWKLWSSRMTGTVLTYERPSVAGRASTHVGVSVTLWQQLAIDLERAWRSLPWLAHPGVPGMAPANESATLSQSLGRQRR